MVHAKRYVRTGVICSAADDDVEIWLCLHGIEKWLGSHLRDNCDGILNIRFGQFGDGQAAAHNLTGFERFEDSGF